MISNRYVKNYCCEDPSLIENYEAAVNDKTQVWDLHHRLETDENKTVKQLIAEGRYFNQPASELIFLTPSEHMRIHKTGENNPMWGKHQSEEWNQKRSESRKGKKYNRIHKMYEHPSKGKHRVYDNPEHTKFHYE